MARIKLTVHPVYFAALLYYIIIGKAIVFLSCLIAVTLHELAHAFVARSHGYAMDKITLMPYGALLGGAGNMPSKVIFKVAISGPIASLILAALTLALWWIIPSLYSYTYSFLHANIVIAIFNLLPAYPLDGSRILLSSPIKNKLRLVRLLRLFGVLIGAIFVALAVASLWFTFNISLVFSGVFLILSATLGGGDEVYSHIASRPLSHKDYGSGVTATVVMLSYNARLIKLLRLIKPDCMVMVHVVDDDGVVQLILDELAISEIVRTHSLHIRLKEVI